MKARQKTLLHVRKRGARPKTAIAEGERTISVERSGVTGFMSKKVFTPGVSRLPPFSPLEPLLQTPHTLFSNSEPLENLPSTQDRQSPSFRQSRDFTRRPLFQLVYLGDEDQNVEVEEVEEIDFAKLRTWLDEGKSVFITRKESEKVELSGADDQGESKDRLRSWYITHV
jgi:hypothetical protein